MKYAIFFVIIVALASCSGQKQTAQTQSPQGPKYTNQTTVAAPSEQQVFWDDVNALDQNVWDELTALWGIQRGDGMWIYPLSEGEKSQLEVIKHLNDEKALALIKSWRTEVRKDEKLPTGVNINGQTPYGNVGVATGNGQQYPMQGVYNGQNNGGGCYVAIGSGSPFWFNGDPYQMYPNGQWQSFTLPTGERGTCWYCAGTQNYQQAGIKAGTVLFGCK